MRQGRFFARNGSFRCPGWRGSVFPAARISAFVTVHGVNSDRGGYPYPPRTPFLGCRPPSAENSPPDCFPGAPGPRSSPAESQDEIRKRISKLFSLGLTYATRNENHKVIFHHSPAKPLNDDHSRGCAPSALPLTAEAFVAFLQDDFAAVCTVPAFFLHCLPREQ